MTFESDFNRRFTEAIAQATVLAKLKLLPWSLTDVIPAGGIIPKKTGFMASTNFWHIYNSGLAGTLDITIHFDTFYAPYVEIKPSTTGSQYFMSRVRPVVIEIIMESIREAFRNANIEIVSMTY